MVHPGPLSIDPSSSRPSPQICQPFFFFYFLDVDFLLGFSCFNDLRKLEYFFPEKEHCLNEVIFTVTFYREDCSFQQRGRTTMIILLHSYNVPSSFYLLSY